MLLILSLPCFCYKKGPTPIARPHLFPSSLDLDLDIARRIDLVGRKLLLFSLPPPRSLSCYKNYCDMGDWVTHPSSTAARKILVIHQLSGEGSPKSPSIGKNKRQKDQFRGEKPRPTTVSFS
jgi:hypothetical protein